MIGLVVAVGAIAAVAFLLIGLFTMDSGPDWLSTLAILGVRLSTIVTAIGTGILVGQSILTWWR